MFLCRHGIRKFASSDGLSCYYIYAYCLDGISDTILFRENIVRIMACNYETECTGILFLLFQNNITGGLFLRFENYNWTTLSSEGDDAVLSVVVVVVFSQYVRQYQCFLLNIAASMLDWLFIRKL